MLCARDCVHGWLAQGRPRRTDDPRITETSPAMTVEKCVRKFIESLEFDCSLAREPQQVVCWGIEEGAPPDFPKVRMGTFEEEECAISRQTSRTILLSWFLPCEAGEGDRERSERWRGRKLHVACRPPPRLRRYSPRCAGGEPTALGGGVRFRENNFHDVVEKARVRTRYGNAALSGGEQEVR